MFAKYMLCWRGAIVILNWNHMERVMLLIIIIYTFWLGNILCDVHYIRIKEALVLAWLQALETQVIPTSDQGREGGGT